MLCYFDRMAPVHRDPRTRPVPPETRALAQRLLQERGPKRAAAALGISRTALLSICAGSPVVPGTLALLREAQTRVAP